MSPESIAYPLLGNYRDKAESSALFNKHAIKFRAKKLLEENRQISLATHRRSCYSVEISKEKPF